VQLVEDPAENKWGPQSTSDYFRQCSFQNQWLFWGKNREGQNFGTTCWG